jgi:hypothetical protein
MSSVLWFDLCVLRVFVVKVEFWIGWLVLIQRLRALRSLGYGGHGQIQTTNYNSLDVGRWMFDVSRTTNYSS